jgi:myo-inositol 2-dehydrogenase/D-chiro-inositol 1-dehydrogenase
MLQVGSVRATEVVAYTDKAVSTDVLEHFLLQRYRAAYAAEIALF